MGLRPTWLALGPLRGEWTDGWTDGKSPHSTGLRPLLGPLPRYSPTSTQKLFMMPLGNWFNIHFTTTGKVSKTLKNASFFLFVDKHSILALRFNDFSAETDITSNLRKLESCGCARSKADDESSISFFNNYFATTGRVSKLTLKNASFFLLVDKH